MTLLCVKLGRYEARNFRSPKGVHGSQCNLPDLEALGIFEIDCYNATITDAMFTPSTCLDSIGFGRDLQAME